MFERTIILPTTDNSGRSLASAIDAIENSLVDIAGGFTRDSVKGAWRGDDGKLYRDSSYRYTVACDAETDARIAAQLPAWCARLRQECLYTSVRQADVAFVSAPVAVN